MGDKNSKNTHSHIYLQIKLLLNNLIRRKINIIEQKKRATKRFESFLRYYPTIFFYKPTTNSPRIHQLRQKKDGRPTDNRLKSKQKTRLCPSAPCSVYQALTFAQYYTPNSRDTWVVSRCRFRVRLLPYKLQNCSCLRQIYE